MPVYLDNSATTRPFDEVIDLMAEIMAEDYGNPSSLHRLGVSAEERLKTARRQVADALGADPEEIGRSIYDTAEQYLLRTLQGVNA